MDSNEEDPEDLFLVDCGIHRLSDLKLNLPGLKHLNLHSNSIQDITNLSRLSTLQTLDLSSNQISVMAGLSQLSALRVLNLSCNSIKQITGLKALVSLVHLNLSYNSVSDLSGLMEMWGDNFQLVAVELQGNQVYHAEHAVKCTAHCSRLKYLVLSDGTGADNPLCNTADYEAAIKRQLPNIITTEKRGFDPGKLLFADTDSSTTHSTLVEMHTPDVDFVLERLHRSAASLPPVTLSASSPATSSTSPPPSHLPQSPLRPQARGQDSQGAGDARDFAKSEKVKPPEQHDKNTSIEKTEMQSRIGQLETTIRQLVQRQADLEKENISPIASEQEEDCARPKPAIAKDSSQPSGHSRIPQRTNRKTLTVYQEVEPTSSSGARHPAHGSGDKAGRRGRPLVSRVNNKDQQHREDIGETYVKILGDLTEERQRRWKAEEAAKKLADDLILLNKRLQERTASEADLACRLQKREEGRSNMMVEVESVKRLAKKQLDELSSCEAELEKANRAKEKWERRANSHEERIATLQQEGKESSAEQKRSYEETKARLSKQVEEISLLHRNVRTLESEGESMRSLLAAREQEHRKAMERLYALDSPKLEDLFQSKVTGLVRQHAQELMERDRRMTESQRKYDELEEEFRMGLQVEADRFAELKEAFEKVSLENAEQKHSIADFQSKDKKSSGIISEMTSLVKDQKEKIAGLMKAKQDHQARIKTCKDAADKAIAELKKKSTEFIALKKEAGELRAQTIAQHSVIVGLRSERELWSKELAQQGAALSSERGTLEANTRMLQEECHTLKEKLEKESDSVKIKTKVITNQTDTIGELKSKLSELESVRSSRSKEEEREKERWERELERERTRCEELEEANSGLQERKEQLKGEKTELGEELESVKADLQKLQAEWRTKSGAISHMEAQVHEMRDTWVQKERKLTVDRDKAIQAAQIAVKKLSSLDETFRQQLEMKDFTHKKELEQQAATHRMEIESAYKKAADVEAEMRDLLKEKESAKVLQEERLKKASEMFQWMQKELQT